MRRKALMVVAGAVATGAGIASLPAKTSSNPAPDSSKPVLGTSNSRSYHYRPFPPSLASSPSRTALGTIAAIASLTQLSRQVFLSININGIFRHLFTSSSAPSEGDEIMEDRIKKYKMVEKPVVADGNCQFRSLADQVLKDQNLHNDVREKVVGWLQLNEQYPIAQSAQLHHFLDREQFPTWKQYCAYMKNSGAWGDHLTLLAAAEIFNAEIWILSSVRVDPGIEPVATITPSRAPVKKIRLAHYHEMHYNSLYPE